MSDLFPAPRTPILRRLAPGRLAALLAGGRTGTLPGLAPGGAARRDGTLGPGARDALVLPHNADWGWRPGPWRRPLALPEPRHGVSRAPRRGPTSDAAPTSGTRLDPEVALFHDAGQAAQVALHQFPTPRMDGSGGPGLALRIGAFDGGYLSLSIDLPATALTGLGRDCILRLDARIESGWPGAAYARLNLVRGPNTEQLLRELPSRAACADAPRVAAFDLACTGTCPRRLDRLWLDLIFAAPAESRIALPDVTLCRYPRARL